MAGTSASQYAGVLNAAFPPVIMKSVVFIAISIPIIEINDIENAVLSAKAQLNFSRTLRIVDSTAMEVVSPAIIARIICKNIGVSG